jgi:hypothetical protein
MYSYRTLSTSLPVLASAALLLATPPLCVAADGTAWGQADSGMRVGVAIVQQKAELWLRIDFQNVGSEARHFCASEAAAGLGCGYDFMIRVIAYGRPEFKAYCMGAGAPGIIKVGLRSPFLKEVLPGQTCEFAGPIRSLSAGAKDPRTGWVPLEGLLRDGYKVRVALHITKEDRFTREMLLRYPDLWTGQIESEEAGLPSSKGRPAP